MFDFITGENHTRNHSTTYTKMSEATLVEAPFTLASLPRPYDAAAGKCLASPVYGLRGQRWRKRSEVAVAVDGDGVSIYNVCASI